MSDETQFRLQQHPVVFLRPHVSYPFAWAGHIPFAYLLIDLLQPRRLVELGTDSGNSYLAFCQAVKHLHGATHCTAVDSWRGDEHARIYSDDVYATLKAYHEPRYGEFSELKRCLFDDAVDHFDDGSIDLLHIDGLHTLDAVRHDFETWRAKLSDCAVVLLHDTQVRDPGFGVHEYFEQLTAQYPTFEFTHSNGLGVIQVGEHVPAAFTAFLDAANAAPESMRHCFSLLAQTIINADGLSPAQVEVATPELVCSVFYRKRDESFDEARAVHLKLDAHGGSQCLRFVLPEDVRPDYIRIDPGEVPGVFAIGQMGVGATPGSEGAVMLTNLHARLGFLHCDPLPVDDPSVLRFVSLERDPHVEIYVVDAVATIAMGERVSVTFQLGVDTVLNEPRLWALAAAQARALLDVRKASSRDFDTRSMSGQMRMLESQMQQRLRDMTSSLDGACRALHGRIAESDASWRASILQCGEQLQSLHERMHLLQSDMGSRVGAVSMQLEQMDVLDTRQGAIEAQSANTLRVIEGIRHAQSRQDAALRILLGRGFLSRVRSFIGYHPRGGNVLGAQADTPLGRWLDFELRPVRHLEAVRGQAQRWRALDNDPGFACDSPMFPLQAGWYRVELEFEQHAGADARPSLYPDYGSDGTVDVRGVSMPFVRAGATVHQGLVSFTHAVQQLRFDPATTPCEFSLRRVRLRRMSRISAAREMLRALEARDDAAQTRPYAHAVAMLARGKVGALGDWLYRSYVQDPALIELNSYSRWVQLYDNMTPARLREARAQALDGPGMPLLSILVPTYNSNEQWLRRCIDSVLSQAWPHWELCIADDASSQSHVCRILREFARRDARIKLVERDRNGHISAASNSALALATGDYVVLLDHDDELHPMALQEVARAIRAHPQWRVIYSDEDKLDSDGQRYDPYMKPDWNYDLLLSHNCISHLGVYQRELVNDVGGFREGFEGSQDWDLALRCIEQIDATGIGHIPRVLYHWRAVPGSTALAGSEKGYAHGAAKKAIAAHLQRIGAKAAVLEMDDRVGNFHIRYELPENPPRVSLVMPTRDGLTLLRRSVESILRLTTYPNYEIVIVDNQSRAPETLDYLRDVCRDSRVRVIAYDHPFNYSALNNHAVANTQGDVIGLVNNDIELITPDWLEEMVGHAMRPGVGAVGAMLYYPDERIQHAGVILGVHGVAAHAYGGAPRGYAGQMGRATLAQSISAVTAACMLVRRSVFEEVGGFNESLRIAFNDVDFCLRVHRAGYRNVWTPFAELYHHESATRGYEDSPEKQARFASEVAYMREQWRNQLVDDPAYSPNFTLSDEPFGLAFPPRERAEPKSAR